MKRIILACLIIVFFFVKSFSQTDNKAKYINGIPYAPITTFEDGSKMNDSKADGIIYKKIGSSYYKRIYSGAIKSSWFGAIGNGIADDTKALQKAITWCVTNHKDLEIDGMHFLSTPLVINRKVDSLEFDHYFILSSNSGGGFVTNKAIPFFTSTIPYKGDPVSLSKFQRPKFP